MYEVIEVPLLQLRPNAWNPNRMGERAFEAEIQSLLRFGYLDPITVRAARPLSLGEAAALLERTRRHAYLEAAELAQTRYEVIDGEHRLLALLHIYQQMRQGRLKVAEAVHDSERGCWLTPQGEPLPPNCLTPAALSTLAGFAQGEPMVRVVDLGEIPDATAKRLTLVLNETRGQAHRPDLLDLLTDLREEVGLEEVLIGLPYDPTDLFLPLPTPAGYEEPALALPQPAPLPPAVSQAEQEEPKRGEEERVEPKEEEGGTEWVRLQVVMPRDAYEVYRMAYELVEEGLRADGLRLHREEPLAHGQVIEALAADYIGGARRAYDDR